MKPEDFDILDLLPQRPPFIMVDGLLHYDPVVTRTRFAVKAGNPFCSAEGLMEESGLIENIAQTCAARMGYKEKTEPQRDGMIRIGFIGMIKTMNIYRRPLVGETLETTIEIREEVFNTTLVDTRVESADDGETLADCEMKIYLTDETIKDSKKN
ncbi:MAG: pseudouridylate synthase [Tannerella sp.]|jgi:predicted hotdog family 3-hydroxylacyl-ACP dehydratase|nr:pseudouridylate synthase [Tannerella sp.]